MGSNTCGTRAIGISSACSESYARTADYVFKNCKPTCLRGWCKQGLDCTAPAQFQFDIVYHETREPATVPYLPMTYDVDASTEWVASCDATVFVLHSPTDIRGTCTGNCCEHKGAVAQVHTPSNFQFVYDVKFQLLARSTAFIQ